MELPENPKYVSRLPKQAQSLKPVEKIVLQEEANLGAIAYLLFSTYDMMNPVKTSIPDTR